MSLLLRSAARVWTKRPAGPVLVAIGILIATLLTAGTELALQSATDAQRLEDEAALGDTLGRVWTPGGYTVDEATLTELQAQLAQTEGGLEPAGAYPLFLERDAIVTSQGTSSSAWRVLGLPTGAIQALGLPDPGEDGALVQPPPGEPAPGQDAQLRVQRAPDEEVTLPEDRLGQLARTVQVGDQYVHDDGDDYVFATEVTEGAKRLELSIAASNNDTDFDLEATSPDGTTSLDDDGSVAQPEMPRLEIEDPAAGNWTIRVHAKFADSVAFRLNIVQVFDARDAQALGRLLQGQGFRAVGAQLGLTEQAVLSPTMRSVDLTRLGPGSDGLVVLPLSQLQQAVRLPEQATGLLVMAGPDQAPLDGFPQDRAQAITSTVEEARAQATSRFDPVQGLVLEQTASDLREERIERIDSTEQLLLVVLPSGVFAGVLLATWAAGLHTRRLRGELQVLAGLGQSRRSSWTLVGLHLGPPFLLGTLAAFALSPLLGIAIAEGIGLETTGLLLPGGLSLLVPAIALVPIGGTAYLTLREAVTGQDPRAGGAPPEARTRWIAAGLWALASAAFLVSLLALDLSPTNAYLVGALVGCTAGLALLWAPALAPLLSLPRMVSVPSLGLFRTRSAHPYLGLAAATATLVLAALVSGIALGQAATPDPALESGGYAVIASTPRFIQDLDPTQATGDATQLLDESLGVEFLMRVEGTGIHSVETGRLQTVYGIDTSFAQRNRHLVTPVGGVQDPVRAAASTDDLALVTREVREAMSGDRVFIEGPQGRLGYDVVGVIESRLVDGVYVSKEALPVHFTQLAGEQRILLPGDVDPEGYASRLQEAFRDDGLTARSSEDLVAAELAGQRRAGTTLQALASVGVATALLLVVLLGLRAKAERRLSDAVFVTMGAKRRHIATGIATETMLPLLVGFLVGGAFVLPLAGQLDTIEGLAFPLLPIDEAALWTAAGLTLAGVLALAIAISLLVAWRAVQGLDQQVLRELG